jgi:hypothetical protein
VMPVRASGASASWIGDLAQWGLPSSTPLPFAVAQIERIVDFSTT